MTAARQRPSLGPVLILAFFAFAMVWSFAEGRLNAQWAAWLGTFLAMELWAAINHVPGATLSERTWAWLGIRPVRPLRLARIPTIAVFLVELTLHFVTGGVYPWSGGLAVILTSSPVALVIGYSLTFERRES